MDESVRRARSRSFGSVADVYERSRPGYPRDAVRWLLAEFLPPESSSPEPGAAAGAEYPRGDEPAPGNWPSGPDDWPTGPGRRVSQGYRPGSHSDPDADSGPSSGLGNRPSSGPGSEPATVVELAAGTGKLTGTLVSDGHRVLAVEPTGPMLERLARNVPPASPVRGVAEAIPLADSCADAVVVAQAFHWFDTDRALAEISRVLRPGGMLGLIWNYRDESVPWVRQLSAVLAAAENIETRQAQDLIETLEWSRLFHPPEYAGFRLWQRIDRAGLLHLVASRSYVATLPPAEREEILDQVGILYDVTARQPEGLVMPYTTTCYRARVRKSA